MNTSRMMIIMTMMNNLRKMMSYMIKSLLPMMMTILRKMITNLLMRLLLKSLRRVEGGEDDVDDVDTYILKCESVWCT